MHSRNEAHEVGKYGDDQQPVKTKNSYFSCNSKIDYCMFNQA